MKEIMSINELSRIDLRDSVFLIVESHKQKELLLHPDCMLRTKDTFVEISLDELINPQMYTSNYNNKRCIINVASGDGKELPLFYRRYIWEKLLNFVDELKHHAKNVYLIDTNGRELAYDSSLYKFADARFIVPHTEGHTPEIMNGGPAFPLEKELYLKKLFHGSKSLKISKLDD